MPNNDNVSIYVDGSNLYHSLSHICGRHDVDFEKFATKLCNGRRLVRIYYYNARVDQTKEPGRYRGQQRFFASLKYIPYLETRFGNLVYRDFPNSPPYEKGIDIKMATDMLVHGHRGNYDVAILVSGDNDFVDALQAVKDFGQHTEVALFGRRGSQRLREVVDRVIELDSSYFSDLWSA